MIELPAPPPDRVLRVPVVLRLVDSDAGYGTARTEDEVAALVSAANEHLAGMGIELLIQDLDRTQVLASMFEGVVPRPGAEQARGVQTPMLAGFDPTALNLFFVGDLGGSRLLVQPSRHTLLLPDATTRPAEEELAHYVLFIFGATAEECDGLDAGGRLSAERVEEVRRSCVLLLERFHPGSQSPARAPQLDQQRIRIPVAIHLVDGPEPYATARDEHEAAAVLGHVNEILAPLGLESFLVDAHVLEVPEDVLKVLVPLPPPGVHPDQFPSKPARAEAFRGLAGFRPFAVNVFFVGLLNAADVRFFRKEPLCVISDRGGSAPWTVLAWSILQYCGLQGKAVGAPLDLSPTEIQALQEGARSLVAALATGSLPVAQSQAPAPPPAPNVLSVPLKIHMVRNPTHGTTLSQAEIRDLLAQVEAIWKPAGLRMHALAWDAPEIHDAALEAAFPPQTPGAGRPADLGGLLRRPEHDPTVVNLYFVRRIPAFGSNPPVEFASHPSLSHRTVLVPDSFRGAPPSKSVAWALGQILRMGTGRDVPADRLAAVGPGTSVTTEEIERVRQAAMEFFSGAGQPAAAPAPVTPPPPPASPPATPPPVVNAPRPPLGAKPVAQGAPVSASGSRVSLRVLYPPDGDTLERALADLDALVGLEETKERVRSLANYLRMEALRRERGHTTEPLSLHCILPGSPGTGKTTVARLLGRLLKATGALPLGQVVEANRAALVDAGPAKVQVLEAFAQARGGVLFVDEAYNLTYGKQDAAGQAAVGVLLQCLEDERDQVALVLAGYEDEMARFLAVNPGLQSRIPHQLRFPDYQPAELEQIFVLLAGRRGLQLTPEGRKGLKELMRTVWRTRDRHFGNARVVRNLFEVTLQRQADRLALRPQVDEDALRSLTEDDIPPRNPTEWPYLADRLLGDSGMLVVTDPPREDSLEAVLADLDALIGLEGPKRQLRTLIDFLTVEKRRREEGLATGPISMHMVFAGAPGTGKTTVARLVGRLLKCLDLLGRGHVVETDRSGIVAGWVGQTALKTSETLVRAMNGVLFVDEAYTLYEGEGGLHDWGREAVAILAKRMEDSVERLCLIVAGYPREMENFLEMNPGLRSRFNHRLDFDDYSLHELLEIFESLCRSRGIAPEPAARERARSVLDEMKRQAGDRFGNARAVRNLFEGALRRQATRLAGEDSSASELGVFLAEDIPSGAPRPVPAAPAPRETVPPASAPRETLPPTPGSEPRVLGFDSLASLHGEGCELRLLHSKESPLTVLLVWAGTIVSSLALTWSELQLVRWLLQKAEEAAPTLGASKSVQIVNRASTDSDPISFLGPMEVLVGARGGSLEEFSVVEMQMSAGALTALFRMSVPQAAWMRERIDVALQRALANERKHPPVEGTITRVEEAGFELETASGAREALRVDRLCFTAYWHTGWGPLDRVRVGDRVRVWTVPPDRALRLEVLGPADTVPELPEAEPAASAEARPWAPVGSVTEPRHDYWSGWTDHSPRIFDIHEEGRKRRAQSGSAPHLTQSGPEPFRLLLQDDPPPVAEVDHLDGLREIAAPDFPAEWQRIVAYQHFGEPTAGGRTRFFRFLDDAAAAEIGCILRGLPLEMLVLIVSGVAPGALPALGRALEGHPTLRGFGLHFAQSMNSLSDEPEVVRELGVLARTLGLQSLSIATPDLGARAEALLAEALQDAPTVRACSVFRKDEEGRYPLFETPALDALLGRRHASGWAGGEAATVEIPVVAHLVESTAGYRSSRTEEDVAKLLEEADAVLKPSGLRLHLEGVRHPRIPSVLLDRVVATPRPGSLRAARPVAPPAEPVHLMTVADFDPRSLNLFLLGSLPGSGAQAAPAVRSVLLDEHQEDAGASLAAAVVDLLGGPSDVARAAREFLETLRPGSYLPVSPRRSAAAPVRLPVVVHLVQAHRPHGTQRTEWEASAAVQHVNELFESAGVECELLEMRRPELGDLEGLASEALNLVFVGTPSADVPERTVIVSDRSEGSPWRALAFGIARLCGLEETREPGRLLNPDDAGTELVEEEQRALREGAERLLG